MNVIFSLLFLNSTCEFLHGNFSMTFPEAKISSSKFAETFSEVGISSPRLAEAFPEVGISSCRLAGAFPEVEITLCRRANIIPEVEITLCRLANIIPEVGLAFRRTGRLILIAKEHANNRTKMENDGIFSFNNDIEYNFLIIQKENGIRGLVLRNRNRLSGFYNNFITNQNFLSHGSNYKI